MRPGFEVRIGFRPEAEGSGLVGTVGVSIASWVMTCVSEHPHKDVCVGQSRPLSTETQFFEFILSKK